MMKIFTLILIALLFSSCASSFIEEEKKEEEEKKSKLIKIHTFKDLSGYAEFKIVDNYLYLLTDNGTLDIYEIIEPTNLSFISSVPVPHYTRVFDFNKIVVNNNKLFVAKKVYDISNKENPIEINSYHSYKSINSINIYDNKLFVSSDHGLYVYDILNSNDEKELNLINLMFEYSSYDAYDIRLSLVNNNILYVVHRNNSSTDFFLSTYNISDISNPILINSLKTNSKSYTFDLKIKDDYLYFAMDNDGLEIYDISSSEPVLFKTINSSLSELHFEKIVFKGNFLFSFNGLYKIVLDLTDMYNIKQFENKIIVNNFHSDGDLAFFGEYLFYHYTNNVDISTLEVFDTSFYN